MRCLALLCTLGGCDAFYGLQQGAVTPDGASMDCVAQPDEPLRYHVVTTTDPIIAVVTDPGFTTFDGARAQCGIYDMLPIVFDDPGELARRAMATAEPHWVGLVRSGTDFIAIDGCASALQNWATGEPMASGECAVLEADGLHVADCT